MMFIMHKDPREWINPDSFIPDRFDSNSPFALKPDGSKRNPLAFNPFLGGKRVCLGKSFAEMSTRLTIPMLFYFFDFEFEE